jgi:hypothetical protein
MSWRPRRYRHRANRGHRLVYVNSYDRFRFGRWEHVTQHFRSWPHQLTLGF